MNHDKFFFSVYKDKRSPSLLVLYVSGHEFFTNLWRLFSNYNSSITLFPNYGTNMPFIWVGKNRKNRVAAHICVIYHQIWYTWGKAILQKLTSSLYAAMAFSLVLRKRGMRRIVNSKKEIWWFMLTIQVLEHPTHMQHWHWWASAVSTNPTRRSHGDLQHCDDCGWLAKAK